MNASTSGVSPQDVGRRIREARLRAGYPSQHALADAAGVSQATVSRAEAGDPVSTLALHRIAEVTGRGLDYFYSPLSQEVDVLLRAPDGAPAAVGAAVDFAVGLLRDYRFLRELVDART